jgi:hypothetical protein
MKNSITNNLTDLLTFCFKNKVEFIYQNEEGENYITYTTEPNKLLTINITNIEDKNLDKMLTDKLEKLHQLFQD